MKISAKRLHNTLSGLSKIGAQPEGGITRLTFSQADIEARKYVTSLIRNAGMDASVDNFGNIIGRTHGVDTGVETVACGSHIDTVPNGGALDGSYGVLAAIEAVRTLHERRDTGSRALQVIVFTEEEGASFGPFIGSRGFTGLLTKRAAYSLKDKRGLTFGEALGAQPSLHTGVSRDSSKNIKSYVELHIEQGPILEHEHKVIGVVESIVGLGDLVIEIVGKAGHAGTTPMRLRKDALLGASKIVIRVRDLVEKTAGNARATIGKLVVEPGAANVIPGRVTVTVDYRNTSVKELELLKRKIVLLAVRVGKEEDLKINCRLESYAKPARMTTRVVDTIESSSTFLGLPSKRMISGAGHDCQNMSRLTDTGMIFVPSHDGISHAPQEFTEPKQLEAGANVLLLTLQRLCNS